MNDAVFPKFAAETDLDPLFRRDGDETNGAAKSVQRAGRLECGGNPQKGGTLAVMTASVDRTRFGVTFGVRGNDKRIHFPEHGDGGTGTPRFHVGIKAGDIPCFVEGISHFFIAFLQVGVGFPFTKARFGIFPDAAFRIQNHLLLLFYSSVKKFALLFHVIVPLFERYILQGAVPDDMTPWNSEVPDLPRPLPD